MATSSEIRLQKLQRLLDATSKYVGEEKARIEKEVTILSEISKRRGWGDLNQPIIKAVEGATEMEVAYYLSGR